MCIVIANQYPAPQRLHRLQLLSKYWAFFGGGGALRERMLIRGQLPCHGRPHPPEGPAPHRRGLFVQSLTKNKKKGSFAEAPTTTTAAAARLPPPLFSPPLYGVRWPRTPSNRTPSPHSADLIAAGLSHAGSAGRCGVQGVWLLLCSVLIMPTHRQSPMCAAVTVNNMPHFACQTLLTLINWLIILMLVLM